MKKQKMNYDSSFYCTCCGAKGFPIARKQAKVKGEAHLKKLYCIHCKREVNHIEIRQGDEYIYEQFKEQLENRRESTYA